MGVLLFELCPSFDCFRCSKHVVALPTHPACHSLCLLMVALQLLYGGGPKEWPNVLLADISISCYLAIIIKSVLHRRCNIWCCDHASFAKSVGSGALAWRYAVHGRGLLVMVVLPDTFVWAALSCLCTQAHVLSLLSVPALPL